MKKIAAMLIAAGLLFAVLYPTSSEAKSKIDEINADLKKIEQDIKNAQKAKDDAEATKKQAIQQKAATEQEINQIMKEISSVSDEMVNVMLQIDDKVDELHVTGQQLQEATDRVIARGQLLDSRVRLMYMNGFVSYLDVLMSSTSFSDFLDRLDTLQTIVGQDKEILAAHKRDKALIVEKEKQIKKDLEEVKVLYAKLEDTKKNLVAKEKKKEVAIASLNQKIEESEEISEAQEQAVMKLAKARAEKYAALEKEKNKNKKSNKTYKGGKLGMPIQDFVRISSPFGPRTHPVTGQKSKPHNGIDFAAPKGTSIFAAESGTVIVAQETSGYGNTVIIDHGKGVWTLYGHIRNGGIKVENGQSVKKGEKIAEVGSTGVSTGNHLHFEVRINEKPVNPAGYLNL
ncbi:MULTISPECIES: murein hydrolase activator EnvC [unclassified Paenibacillus]|uniref:murein hydrolase activator EnvC family protein n=1 Tax=unclassified Paenibacillus TaxID=185978 RepID=UPI001C1056FC|nr:MULTISPECIES: peptidoglycan DD-metalloendopeptidase family protein [unclassified Paenibacillus]MBU5442266.1 peptidoglycan DD-metalloendopeptidase family protein [Paenibacillus sp. MSJ-34]CAH0121821.1 hypothetical protein PAE9249_04355 [Paenibacillus sp. CECT 9249]